MKKKIKEIDHWIDKNVQMFNGENRSIIDAETVWFNEDYGGFLYKQNIQHVFNSADIKHIAGLKLLFKCLSESRLVYYYSKIKNGNTTANVLEIDDKIYREYELPNVIGLDELITNYQMLHIAVKIDFKTFYKEAFK